MTDEHDPATEDRLIRALRARDAEVSPTRGSLSAIGKRGSSPSPWRRAPLVIAAALVLIGGIAAGAALLGDDGDEQPDVAVDNPTTTVTTTTTEPGGSSTTSSTTTTTTTTIPPTPEWLAREGLIVWPRDSRSFSSMEQAASTYVEEVLGVEDPDISYECCDDRTAIARLRARGEGGRELDRDAAIMTLVDTGGTWDIVTVKSDLLAIDRVTATPAGLVVAGRGTAFEGSAAVNATSYCHPDTARGDLITVGSGPDSADTPFAAFVAAPDCDVAIVAVTASGVAEGATPDHAEVAVGVAAPEELVVMRVEPDDVLNVRADPVPDAATVATLAPDAAGIARTGETSGNWWEITTPDGVTGWADRAFLSVQHPLDTYPAAADLHDALIGLTTRAVQVLDQGLPAAPVNQFSVGFGESVDVGGIGVYADAPSLRRIDSADLFDGTDLDWAPFPDDVCGAECTLTVSEFLDLRTEMLAAATFATDLVSYGPERTSAYLVGLPDLYTERFATVRFEIPSSSDDELDWRTYSFVYDFSGALPEIITIWRWGWTP